MTTIGDNSGRPFVIGVTGNIACGKSTVMGRLQDLGAETIDADRVYHRLIEPGTPLTKSIADRFGRDVLNDDGGIDRAALGRIVFRDPSALADLERITHPAIAAEIANAVSSSAATVLAIDAVKLIEGGLRTLCDRVWLVICDEGTQASRLMARNGLSREDALRRIAAQPPVQPKLRLADAVIDNSGMEDETLKMVDQLWAALPILSI
jgi:dephospho-CoA kinase